jgi:hypothetical protein
MASLSVAFVNGWVMPSVSVSFLVRCEVYDADFDTQIQILVCIDFDHSNSTHPESDCAFCSFCYANTASIRCEIRNVELRCRVAEVAHVSDVFRYELKRPLQSETSCIRDHCVRAYLPCGRLLLVSLPLS